MSNMHDLPADPRRWPLQIQRFDHGWSVTVFDAGGHVRHVVSVDSEIQAYRAAYRLAGIYRHKGPVVTIAGGKLVEHDLEQLMGHHR